MESVGFSIAYDNIDLNEDELDEIADAMDEIDDEMNSQFNRKMNDDDNNNNGINDDAVFILTFSAC